MEQLLHFLALRTLKLNFTFSSPGCTTKIVMFFAILLVIKLYKNKMFPVIDAEKSLENDCVGFCYLNKTAGCRSSTL